MKFHLNLQQKRFCEFYVSQPIDKKAMHAGLRAGYAKQAIKSTIHRLLKKTEVQEYIAELRKEAQARHRITQDDIINELAKIAFFDVRSIYDEDGNLKKPHELSAVAAASIAGIEVEEDILGFTKTKRVKLRDKIQALEKLWEMLGYKVQVEKKIIHDAQGNLIGAEYTELSSLPIVFK